MARIIRAMSGAYLAAIFAAELTFLAGVWILADDAAAVSPAMLVLGLAVAMVYALPGFVVVRSLLSWAQVGSVPVFALSATCAQLVMLILPHLVFNGGNLALMVPQVTGLMCLAAAVAGATYRVVERHLLKPG